MDEFGKGMYEILYIDLWFLYFVGIYFVDGVGFFVGIIEYFL